MFAWAGPSAAKGNEGQNAGQEKAVRHGARGL